MERIPFTVGMLIIIVASLAPHETQADVYKWQDETGKWHFGDKPPTGLESKRISTEVADNDGAITDLAGKLGGERDLLTPIERATLAVVTIETALSESVGFFVSPEGHLLTNCHVVRPTDSSFWAEQTKRIEDLEAASQDMKDQVADAYKPVKELETKLAGLNAAIEREDSSVMRAELRRELQNWEREYEYRKSKYVTLRDEYKSIKREFDKLKSDFEYKSAATIVSSNFKVVLKNGDALRARLIAVSDTDDLPLLRVDGVKSPHLEAAAAGVLTQGARVFAIGSPLGLRDTVTAGVATNISDAYIGTDATVLPGSSGGPLLTEDGHVVGINTLKISGGPGAEGFGIAIPFARAEAAFDW